MMVLSIQNVKEELEMAHKRVTMQDIADVCGLSRNTVSKIFNGKGAVPEATRRMVIQKARELGYHQFPDNLFDNGESVAQAPQIQNIALLTNKMPTDYHFGTFLLPVLYAHAARDFRRGTASMPPSGPYGSGTNGGRPGAGAF